jgi:Zn-dependent M28 family amino/carboxypeptidase
MHRAQTLLIFLLAMPALCEEFSGLRAYNFTRQIVELGPRPPGSATMERQREMILKHLKSSGCEITEHSFRVRTPAGPMTMKNLICRFGGVSGQAVAFTGHYDTKMIAGVRFLGANDGGSSTGLLMEMARILSGKPRKHEVFLVWLDGEEAIEQWSERDGLYGSRQLAEQWKRDGTLRRILALVNVDMIGDRDLELIQEMNSTAWLRETIWQIGRDLGYGGHFGSGSGYIEDDHIPFLRAGVPAVNLIDFHYGPGHGWWHTEHDTLDKLAPESFEAVGRVLVEFLRRMEKNAR